MSSQLHNFLAFHEGGVGGEKQEAWRGKGVGSSRIGGICQVLNIAPGLGPAKVSSRRTLGEALGSLCAFESLGRGRTQESSQKEDRFSSDIIVRFKHNCFVKDQNDSLGASITSVGS